MPSPNPRPTRDTNDFQGVQIDVNDPVEKAINDVVRLYRIRRPGLVIEGDVFATFGHSARALDLAGFGIPESLLHRIQLEQASINAMRRAGTLFDQTNEEAEAAYLEMAFHASLLYAWVRIWMGGR